MLIIYDNSKGEVYLDNVISVEVAFQALIATGKFCSCTVDVLKKDEASAYKLCLSLEDIGNKQIGDSTIAHDFSLSLSNLLNDARLHGRFPYACEILDSNEIGIQKIKQKHKTKK